MAFLRAEEEQWRLRSRALWMSSGDKNTKYFHKLASFNRIRKHIWEIKRENGDLLTGQENIKEEASTISRVSTKHKIIKFQLINASLLILSHR
jgi:hypothetical protein